MRKAPAILIFDVGKTNKKLLVFDSRYQLLHAEAVRFEEMNDEDGYPCDDVDSITRWIRTSFERISGDERFDLKAANFSAYGASFVCVDQWLKPMLPLSNYLKPYLTDLQNLFYDRYGGRQAFSKKTASPVLGSLNSGMQLFRLKQEKPEEFDRLCFALHLPQYLSSVLTHKAVSEITSIGCHTNLWDFDLKQYHEWVKKEGIDAKLPPIVPATECQIVSVEHGDVHVGIGMHDSSAALIPYLKSFRDPFVLISTGTWCISLNPFNHEPLIAKELTKDCLCYMDHSGQPVKASRLFAGQEHEQQVRRLADQFSLDPGYFTNLKYNSGIAKKWTEVAGTLRDKQDQFSFRNKDLTTFDDADEAYHWLMFDIVASQVASTNLVIGTGGIKRIFVDGGFGKNSIYMNLMAHAFQGLEVCAAKVPEASALGAALVIHENWNERPVPSNLIELKSFSSVRETL